MKNRLYFIATLTFVLLSIFVWIGTYNNWWVSGPEKKAAKHKFIIPSRLYGIPIDSFKVKEYVVKRDQNLSDILAKWGLSVSQIGAIDKSARGVFDLKMIKSEHKYAVFIKKKTTEPRFIVYEDSPMEYVVFKLYDDYKVEIGKQQQIKQHRLVAGVVRSSLWSTMTEENICPMLAISLSDIFQYSIDFFGVQPGDKFRVIYDETQVGGQTISINRIYAAEFVHLGKSFIAVPFVQDGKLRFFDQFGRSLRKAFRKAPLDYFRITSRFTNSRFHPILKIYRPHHGVDYAAPIGTPVYSIGDGVVEKKAFQPTGGGNYLLIKHNDTYSTSYMHLRNFAGGIGPGTKVKMGQVIGFVGRTGLASGPHLDFRVYLKGTPIDPLTMVSPNADPIQGKDIKLFRNYSNPILKQLASIPFDAGRKKRALRFFP